MLSLRKTTLLGLRWHRKQGNHKGGPGGRYDGSYTSDYEFVAGSGDLDKANGMSGPTPEYPEGTYHHRHLICSNAACQA